MAKRVERWRAEAQEKPGREARRRPRIGLRLVLIGEHGVEDVSTEARLGGVSARYILVSEDAVEPAIGFAPFGEIVNELDMAVAAGKFSAAIDKLGKVQGNALAPLQATEAVARPLVPFRIV